MLFLNFIHFVYENYKNVVNFCLKASLLVEGDTPSISVNLTAGVHTEKSESVEIPEINSSKSYSVHNQIFHYVRQF